MKTPHSEKRKQVWIAAWTSYTNASNSTNVDSAAKWADRALKDFDERFKDPSEIKAEKIKDNQAEFIKMVQNDYFAIAKLFPSMSKDELLKEIENNLLLVRDIKSRYEIIYKTEGDTLITRIVPKHINNNTIIPERDTFNPLPPEYPNGG